MDMNQEEGGKVHQVLVKLLDGSHKFLNFTTPTINIQNLKHHIQTLTSIPSYLQLLLLNQGCQHPTLLQYDHQTLDLFSSGKFPVVVHLLLRLRGGKGGFGSLLRGAATKAGQKKTNNFDACRDMSGRRMRHVNAEKKLEEWMAESEERKLEKMAEDYIKKMNKEMVKKGKGKGGVDTDKYVQKYREDSERCREEMERSVRESIKGLVTSKRKGATGGDLPESKRFKIWFGKRKLANSDSDSDSEDMDEDDSDKDEDEENNKSVVIDNENHSNSSKEAEGSSDSVAEARHDMVSLDSGASESGSEEEKVVLEKSQESVENRSIHEDTASVTEPKLGISEELIFQHAGDLSLQTSNAETRAVQEEKEVSSESYFSNVGERVCQAPVLSGSGTEEATVVGASGNSSSILSIQDGVVTEGAEPSNLEKPLNFEEVNSAAELQVLGMERLKSELQARGLKCGGTLQERAARLFLLKTTPLEMLPKKLLAKK